MSGSFIVRVRCDESDEAEIKMIETEAEEPEEAILLALGWTFKHLGWRKPLADAYWRQMEMEGLEFE